ncbi:VanW family protein [Fervidibacillus halotolerans]|uniref:VanW family protein n=1 Tax=Fervidibacillus halotolerans TaxID=2980027 RepID=A0A9E8M0V3_9BACI|nr:VanW family protein [Fervidibacillus halotolerans]WAA12845.1 VanW family protein [Fervidibacillus halotolerans]
MGKRKIFVLAFIFLLALILIYLLFVRNQQMTFPTGSTIGGVDVGGKTEEEAKYVITETIVQWKKEPLQLITSKGLFPIPKEVIQFDVDSSISLLKEQLKKPWYQLFQKTKGKQIPLNVSIQLDDDLLEQLNNLVDVEQTIEKIHQNASYLKKSEIEAVQLENLEETVIVESTWQIPENYHFIDLFIEELNNITIEPGEIFSFLNHVVEKLSHYNEEEGNFVASQLYSVFLQTNVQILERHSQGVIPTYATAGIEAEVNNQEQLDLMVKNIGTNPLTLKATQKGNQLTIQVVSQKSEKTYTYQIINKIDVQFPTIIRYDKQLNPDEEKIIQNGIDGKRVEVYRIPSSSNDSKSERISRDYYPSTPKIVAVSYRNIEGITAGEGNEMTDSKLEDELLTNPETEDETTEQMNETDEQKGNEGSNFDSIYEQPNIVK